ncbi:MAG: 50S ribosomal protein L4, partial [Aquificota bacterium]
MKVLQMELKPEVFGVEVNRHVLWEVVKWQLASRRQGTHSTKTRGEVAYSGRKLLPQKGTGNARHGDRGANIFVGGGVAHGPKPRDYYYALPKKVRRLGLKMALSLKAKENNLLVV